MHIESYIILPNSQASRPASVHPYPFGISSILKNSDVLPDIFISKKRTEHALPAGTHVGWANDNNNWWCFRRQKRKRKKICHEERVIKHLQCIATSSISKTEIKANGSNEFQISHPPTSLEMGQKWNYITKTVTEHSVVLCVLAKSGGNPNWVAAQGFSTGIHQHKILLKLIYNKIAILLECTK